MWHREDVNVFRVVRFDHLKTEKTLVKIIYNGTNDMAMNYTNDVNAPPNISD